MYVTLHTLFSMKNNNSAKHNNPWSLTVIFNVFPVIIRLIIYYSSIYYMLLLCNELKTYLFYVISIFCLSMFCHIPYSLAHFSWLPVPGRPTTLAYGRAGAGCACSRCGTGGLFFLSPLAYIPFLMHHLLGDGWTYWNIVVLAAITHSVTTGGMLAKSWLTA